MPALIMAAVTRDPKVMNKLPPVRKIRVDSDARPQIKALVAISAGLVRSNRI